MQSVILTNIARNNMPQRGPDCGEDVYPFWDTNFSELYNALLWPDLQLANVSLSLITFNPQEKALQHCWSTSMVTDFCLAPGQLQGWPFSATATCDRNVTSFPSDHAALDTEDLGANVFTVLGHPTSPAPSPSPPHPPLALQAQPMDVDAPEQPTPPPAWGQDDSKGPKGPSFTNTCSNKYHLKPSSEF